MKCDLHIHTRHSGQCNVPVLSRICRESYNDPDEVYDALKRRGMNLVTVTDHDSIGAAESLRRHRDFFLSEEATCTMPGGNQMHVGIYDIDERQHIEIGRRRDDLESLIAYLREQKRFFTANHVFSGLTGKRSARDFELFEGEFPALETLNGCMPARSNRAAAELAAAIGRPGVGGSDAHAIRSAGSAWTEVPGARTREEFFAGLRAGAGRTGGTPGNYFRLTRDVFSIGGGMVRDNPFTAPVVLLGVLVPVITLVNYWMEAEFVRRWSHRASSGQTVAGMAAEEIAA